MASSRPGPDIMHLVGQAAKALKRLRATEVYVFGSVAAGRALSTSDVDIAVRGLPSRLYMEALGAAWDIVGRPVDLVSLDDDTPFTRCLERKDKLRRVG